MCSLSGAARWAIGLRPFVTERGESARRQLEGTLPSAGDGSGDVDLC